MNYEMMISTLFEINEAEIQKIYEQRESDIISILRNKIDKPIRGEITKNKLRWRGIKEMVFDDNRNFIGLNQRGKVIGVNGIIGVFKNGKMIKS